MEKLNLLFSLISELSPIIVPIITSIISAVIAYFVSKQQVKSSERRLDKEINAEIKKVKYQYELEQKRDDSNFLNKFKLEKLAKLYELIGRYGRYNTRKINLIRQLSLFNNDRQLTDDEIDDYLDERKEIEDEEFSENLIRQITIEVCYFSEIREEWNKIHSYNFKIIDIYIDQILGHLAIKDEKYFINKIPENYTLNNYLKDIERSYIYYINLIESIEKEIVVIMSKLEGQYD